MAQDPLGLQQVGPPSTMAPMSRLDRVMADVRYGQRGQTRLERVMGEIQPTFGEYASAAGQSFTGQLLEGFAGAVEAPSIVRRRLLEEEHAADMTLGEAAGRWLRSKAAGMRQPVVEGSKPSVGKFLATDVAGGLGSTVAMGAEAALGVAAGIPPWVSVALSGAATNGAAGYHEARLQGASPDEAWTSFVWNALVGTTNAVPVAGQLGRIFGRADKLSGGWLKRALVEGGEEFTQESFEQMAGNYIAQAVAGYDEDRKLLEGVAQGGGAGGLSGLIASALASAVAPGRGRLTRSGPLEPGQTPIGTLESIKQPIATLGVQGPIEGVESRGQSNTGQATPEQTYSRELATQHGARMTLDPTLPASARGVYQGEGDIRVNPATPEQDVARTTLHELTHFMREVRAETWEEMSSAIRTTDPEGWQRAGLNYVADFKRGMGQDVSPDLQEEEATARYVEGISEYVRQAMENPEALETRSPGLLHSIARALVKMLGDLAPARLREYVEKPLREARHKGIAKEVAKAFAVLRERALETQGAEGQAAGVEAPSSREVERPVAKAEPEPPVAPAPVPDAGVGAVPVLEERVKIPEEREHLRAVASRAGWDQEGGKLIFSGPTEDQNRRVIGRTNWVAKAEWWPDRPVKMNATQVQRLVERATSDNPGTFTKPERRMLEFLLEQEREDSRYSGGMDVGQVLGQEFLEREAIEKEGSGENVPVEGVPFAVAPRRYRYKMKYRPPSAFTLPKGLSYEVEAPSKDAPFGIVSYEKPLSFKDEEAFDLEPLDPGHPKNIRKTIELRRERLVNALSDNDTIIVSLHGKTKFFGPDTRKPGRFRLTSFTETNEPSGHEELGELSDALDELARMGAEPSSAKFAVAPRRIIGYDLVGEPVYEEAPKPEKVEKPKSRETQGGLFTPKQTQAFDLPNIEVEKPRKYAVAGWHGSPHDFEEFSTSKIGTGEGAQAYGHGLYFTDKREIAEHYREALARRNVIPDDVLAEYFTPGRIVQGYSGLDKVLAFTPSTAEHGWSVRVIRVDANGNVDPQARERTHFTEPDWKNIEKVLGRKPGRTYEVELAPDDDEYLLWDKPLSEQSEKVKKALDPILRRYFSKAYGQDRFGTRITGQGLYEHIAPGPLRDSKAARAASQELHAAGIRGIKYLAGDGSRVKGEGSFNYVIFDDKDVKITRKYAVAPTGSFDLPDDTRTRQFTRAVLDSFEALRLTPELDSAISRRPGLAYGRAERVQAQTIRGMIEIAKAVGKENADRFLYALHAPRRNEIIAERSKGKHGAESNPGSGMRTSEAQAITRAALAGPNKAEYQRLRELNRRLNVERLDALTGAGLLSSEQRTEWEQFGPDFVPLRTADDPSSKYGGGSLNVTGKESQRAEGRSTLADSPLSFGVARFAEAVERAERNRVGQMLADFVEANPSPEWNVYTSRDAVPEGWEVLSLKRDGAPVYIGTSNEQIASAFKQMDAQKATGVMRAAVAFRKLMHALIIKYNPPFALSNAFRDVGTASAKLAITHSASAAAKVVGYAPPAMFGAWRAIRNEGAGGVWGEWYREARDAGALVGWNEMGSFQDVEDAIKRSKRSAILTAIEQVNRGAELGTRIAIYRTMRESGKTQKQAALITRDGTTDFARRGNYSSQLSALYLFANANIQGTASLWRAIAANPARGSVVISALVAAGYILSMASRALGDWDDIPEYAKQRMGGVAIGDTLYGVPLPYGFDVFYYLGSRLEAAQNGRTEDSLGSDILTATLQSFSPVQGSNIVQALTPTMARPLVEISQNRDWAGIPIRPQQSPFDRTPSPRSEQTFASVDPTLKAVTQGLNRMTGGDSVRSGVVDVSAEDVEHVIKFLGGGAGANATRFVTAVNHWLRGEPVRPSDVPFIRTLMTQVPESAVANLYYDNLTAIEREGEAKKKGEAILDERALSLSAFARAVDRRVKALRKLSKEKPDERKKYEQTMREAMAALNAKMATR